MRVLALALLAPVLGCATQTMICEPSRPAVAYGVVRETVVVRVAPTTKVRTHKVYVVSKLRRHGNIYVVQMPDGSLSFTDRPPKF